MKIYAFADEACPNIDGQIIAMKRNNLDGVEIRNVDGTNVSSITLEKAKEVKAKFDAAGLDVWSIGSPIGKIVLNDNFEKHLDSLKHTCEIANVLDSKNIRVFSFFIPKGTNADDYKNEVFEKLEEMLTVSKQYGITLCHENEKGIYGDIARRCLEIHKALPELKCVFDPANFIQCGQDTNEAYDMLSDYVYYMHIKDALADGNVVPAGYGVGNISKLLKRFKGTATDCVTIEPHLKVFDGLKNLEQSGEEIKVGLKAYASGDEAFDAACNALRVIL